MGSMLYLSADSAPRAATGLPLAYGTLTFYISGTTALATVYDASDLATPLTNPVEADADGLWPEIWLDPTVTYRVILNDQNGVLQYDVDPYLPYAGGAFQYLDAQVQAITAGAVVPGAELAITVNSATASVYADSDLSAALPNPVVADSGGRFQPIYLSAGTIYSVNGADYPPQVPGVLSASSTFDLGTFGLEWTAAFTGCTVTGFELLYRADAGSAWTSYATYAAGTLSDVLSWEFLGNQFKCVTYDACGSEVDSNVLDTLDYFTEHTELLMLTNGGGIYPSTDGGVTFSTSARGAVGLASTSGQCVIAYSPDLGVLVASNSTGTPPRYSLDRGATWADCVHATAWPSSGYIASKFIHWVPAIQKFVMFYNLSGLASPPLPYMAVSADGVNWSDVGSTVAAVWGAPYFSWVDPNGVSGQFANASGANPQHRVFYDGSSVAKTYYTLSSPVNMSSRNPQSRHPTNNLLISCDNNRNAYAADVTNITAGATNPFSDLGSNTQGGNRAVWCDSLGLWVMGGSFNYPRWSADGSAGSWVTGSGVNSGAAGAGTYHTDWCPETGAAFVCGVSSGSYYAKRSADGKVWANCNPFHPVSGAQPQQVIELTYWTKP